MFRKLLSLLTVVLLGTGVAAAQIPQQSSDVANMSAIAVATVTITKMTDLDFGFVFPNTSNTVNACDATAASFVVTTDPVNDPYTVTVTPTNLTYNGTGPDSLPISAWSATSNTVNSCAGGSPFSAAPWNGVNDQTPTGTKYYWFGATVSNTPTHTAGPYSGTLTVTLDYN